MMAIEPRGTGPDSQYVGRVLRFRPALLFTFHFLPSTYSEVPNPPIATYFTFKYSSSPWRAPSRPIPDSFTPPNGATSVEMTPSFTPTIPHSSAAATRHTRPTSRS